jgi:hypothetical protein
VVDASTESIIAFPRAISTDCFLKDEVPRLTHYTLKNLPQVSLDLSPNSSISIDLAEYGNLAEDPFSVLNQIASKEPRLALDF